jgi:acyl carrier protein
VDPRETWRELAIGPAEGWDAFLHTLSLGGEPHVLLSTSNLEERYERWVERQTSSASGVTGVQQSFEPLSSAVFEPKTPVMRGRAEILTKYVPPENELQARIAAVLSAMLGIEPIGIHDDFLDLGGDSLLGIRVVGRLRQVLNADLAPDLLFEAPTVAEIASLVSRDSAASRT